MQRRLAPEILDELSPHDPEARQSRADLQRINWFMGNARHIARELRSAFSHQPPKTILELGAGDGTLMLEIARRVAPEWGTPLKLSLLDRQSIVAAETIKCFQQLGWTVEVLQIDLMDWTRSPVPRKCDAVICNLFAHHFGEAQLREVFRSISEVSSLFVACEPWRNRFAFRAAPLLWLLGCNQITRHDARVSILAGFREQELSALWPKESLFLLTEKQAGLFSQLFVAARADLLQNVCS